MARDSSGPKNEPRYDPLGQPADAADLTEVAAYAAMVGNLKVGLSTDRTALTGADRWTGLCYFETDTGLLYEYDATNGWEVVGGRTQTSAIVAVGSYAWSINRLHKMGRLVVVHGYAAKTTDFGNAEVAGTIPAGFRPANEWSTASLHYTGGFGVNNSFVQVNAAGEIRMNVSALSGMRYGFLVGSWVI